MSIFNRLLSLPVQAAFLIVFTFFLAIPLALFWAWPVSKALQNEIDQVEDRHLLIAQNLGLALERYYRDVTSTFEYFAVKSGNDESIADADTLLKNMHFRHICIIDPQTGNTLSGYGEIVAKCPKTVPATRFALFKDMTAVGKTIVSGVLPGPQKQPLIYLLREENGFIAVGALQTTYFTELGKSISFGVRGHAAIVDQHGRVLSHPLADWAAAMKDISKVSAVRRMLAGETGVETFYSPALKDDMIAGFTPVKGPGWGVMIPQPVSELRNAAQGVQKSALSVFAIGILIAAVVSLFMTIPILRPLAAVVRGAKRMEEGETDVRVAPTGGFVPREFRTLLTSFNAMAESVTTAQKEIEESENSYRDLVEGSIQGMYIQKDWELLFANPAMAEMFGYGDVESLMAIGRIDGLFAADDIKRLRGYQAARNKGEFAPRIYESKCTKKDGTQILVEFRITPVRWHGNNALQCVVMDITDRRNAENQLIVHRDNLQKAVDDATHELSLRAVELQEALSKEKEMGARQRQFVTMVSHEFRTPLSIIDSSAQLLERRGDRLTPEDTLEKVERIRTATKRLTRLLESTIAAAMLDDGNIRIDVASCNISALVRDVCRQQQDLGSNHKVWCELHDLPETIQADAGSIEQVIGNLVSNAIKYSPNTADVRVVARTEGTNVVVAVHDQGLGIDQADLPNMFSRYFRAKSSAGIAGTGIGLNLAKILVELHNGSISVESKEGEGSIFTVRLPIAGPGLPPASDFKVAQLDAGPGEIIPEFPVSI